MEIMCFWKKLSLLQTHPIRIVVARDAEARYLRLLGLMATLQPWRPRFTTSMILLVAFLGFRRFRILLQESVFTI